MKKYIIILFFLFSVIACSRKSKTPDYVIPQEEMIDILVDVHLIDGLLTNNRTRLGLIERDSLNYYDAIFKARGYTQHDFDTSVFYYGLNINTYDEMYEEVLNILNELDAKVKEEELETNKAK